MMPGKGYQLNLGGRAAHSLGTSCWDTLDILHSSSAAAWNEIFMGGLLAVWLTESTGGDRTKTCGQKALQLLTRTNEK